MQTTNTAQQGPSSTTPLTIHTNRLGPARTVVAGGAL